MEFAAPTRKAPMAMMADSRGAAGMELDSVAMDATKTTPWERRFNPYDFNGGECQRCLGEISKGDNRRFRSLFFAMEVPNIALQLFGSVTAPASSHALMSMFHFKLTCLSSLSLLFFYRHFLLYTYYYH
jgi:hypothetical protein